MRKINEKPICQIRFQTVVSNNDIISSPDATMVDTQVQQQELKKVENIANQN